MWLELSTLLPDALYHAKVMKMKGMRDLKLPSLNFGSWMSRITTFTPVLTRSSMIFCPIPLHPPVTRTSSRSAFHGPTLSQLFTVRCESVRLTRRRTTSAPRVVKALQAVESFSTCCAISTALQTDPASWFDILNPVFLPLLEKTRQRN